jgi:hypothetical protein
MVGEIRDEFRLNENDWLKQADGTFIGKASLPIFRSSACSASTSKTKRWAWTR